jgi:CheY-like chemotaxis protein
VFKTFLKPDMNILYVEDDLDDCDLFVAALNSLNLKQPVNCILANDGEEALAKLIDFPQNPDLIFLDINMPKMHGRELIHEIRTNEKLRGIPVVIYSTSINSIEVEFFNRYGVFSFFNKPTDFAQLIRSLKAIFDLKPFLAVT